MKKSLLLFGFLLFAISAAVFSQAVLLSQFTWDTSSDPKVAVIGPNAVSQGLNAVAMASGNATPQGAANGCNIVFGSCVSTNEIDLVIPNTGNIFDVPEITYKIDYNRSQAEGQAWFFERDDGNASTPYFEMGIQNHRFTARFCVDNGAGGFNTHNVTLWTFWGGATPDQVPVDGIWRTFEFRYNQSSGVAEVYVDGVFAANRVTGTPGAALVWPNTPLGIGSNTDNNNTGQAVIFDNAEVGIPVLTPVEYNYFEGEQIGVRSRLMWETATESNSAHFKVLRANPIGEIIEYFEIGEVQAAGNSDSPIAYEFFDPNPQPGSNMYRLQQIDLNGDSHLSPIIEVNFGVGESGLVAVYPNPVQIGDPINIKFQSGNERSVQLLVFDLQGRVLINETHELDKKMSHFKLSSAMLPKGLYIVRAVAGGRNYTQKVIVK